MRSPALALFLTLFLSACSTSPARGVYHQEKFDSTETFARSFEAPPQQTCEAARRTLLSQGYLIVLATGEQVTARKSFQPGPDAHVEIEAKKAAGYYTPEPVKPDDLKTSGRPLEKY